MPSMSPIALFAYKRVDRLASCIDSLKNNPESSETDIVIFSDGPYLSEDLFAVNEVRNYLKSLQGFKSIKIVIRDSNLGLSRSIITGVSEVLKDHETVIVVEDDLLLSPFFLGYMNDALDLYRNEDKVISVHGYCYPIEKCQSETFFLRGADCWGWGTWKRGWKYFCEDGQSLLSEIEVRKLSNQFDLDGAFGFTQMLYDQVAGKIDSWAIRWHASAFLQDKLTLYPSRSLVSNQGFDSSGTHCSTTDVYDVPISNTKIDVKNIPICESSYEKSLVRSFFRNGPGKRRSLIQKLLRKLKKLIPHISTFIGAS